MSERIITIETRLQNDSELVKYLNDAVTTYEFTKRKIWHEYTNPNYNNLYSKESEFTKHCRDTNNLHSRTINSIMHEVKGLLNAYKELKLTELSALKSKIESQENRVNKTIEQIKKLKPKVTINNAAEKELHRYRRNKTKLYYQKNRLNRLKTKYNNLQYKIDNNIYDICFGTKQMFRKQYNLEVNHYRTHKKWYNDFIKSRDKNVFFLGASNETMGNSMVQMHYDKNTNLFNLKLRKIEMNDKKRIASNYISYSNLTFKNHKKELIELLNNHELNNKKAKAISYRFHREHNKWYIQIILTISFDNTSYKTRKEFGVIGLDYNDGFIQLAETDKFGNLVNLKKFDLKYHGCGNRAKTEIAQVINIIVKYAKSVGKDISMENLDFKRTKSKQLKGQSNKGKSYNRMTHTFDYSRYKQKIQDISFNNEVYVHLVNPKNTSKIGKQKYSDRMKLTIHQAAAYVIARRYQGFKDNLKQTKSK